MDFDPQHPSSRSTPDSTDFEKVEREDVMDAPMGFEADSPTPEDAALRGAGDAPPPRIKLESPTTASSGPPTPADAADVFGFLSTLPPWGLDLVYWRRPQETLFVFVSLFSLLLSLSLFSVLTVASYAALGLLTTTFSFVTYRKCLAAVQKSGEGNPFQAYLGEDVSEKVNQDCQQCLEKAITQATSLLVLFRHYFLIVDIFDSLKFAVFLWTLTYVGALFNLLTLLILVVVSLFTLPKIYEVHRDQIDAGLALLTDQLAAQYPVVRAKFTETFGGIWEKIAVMIPSKAKSQ